MNKHLIKLLCRSVCAVLFFFVFYSFSDLRMQVAMVGALVITAVYFDAEKWDLK